MSTDNDAIRTYLLADSDRSDREERRRLNNWRAGWTASQHAHDDAYEAGYADGVLSIKHGQHQAYNTAQQLSDWVIHEETAELTRWELRGQPRTRETFSHPHPDDYQGTAT